MSITIKRTLCPTGSVSNSDASYSTTVDSGGSLVLPDSQINVNGVDQGDVVSVKTIDVNITDGTSPVTPDSVSLNGNILTVAVPVGVSPVGADIPKTNQSTAYNSYDDGTYQAGRATDSFTLSVNNPFGNTNRYTDELGGSTYANGIMIDWFTYNVVTGKVLGYDITKRGTNIFLDACTNAAALTTGSFSGWRLPNMNEYFNLFKIGYNRAFNWSPLNIGLTNDRFWTSSSAENYTNQPIYVGNQFLLGSIADTNAYYWLAVRTFTVTGTTLS